jgi:hypothetical protein
MKAKLIFAWYDLWIGVFIDRAKRRVYILPLPCLGIVIDYTGPAGKE